MRCDVRKCQKERNVKVELGAGLGLSLCDDHGRRWLASQSRQRASFQLAEWRETVEAEDANGVKAGGR